MAKVVYACNPIFPQKGLVTKDYAKPVRICDIINDLKIDTMCICTINGRYKEYLSEFEVCNREDYVYIQAQVESDDTKKVLATVVTIAAVIVGTILSAGAATPLLAGLIKGGFIIAGALIAAGIRSSIGNKALEDSNGASQQTQSPSYSLSAAGNRARAYESLPLVCGYHRMFPDFASLPYREHFKGEGDLQVNYPFVPTGGLIPAIDITSETWIEYFPRFRVFIGSDVCTSCAFEVLERQSFDAVQTRTVTAHFGKFFTRPGKEIFYYYLGDTITIEGIQDNPEPLDTNGNAAPATARWETYFANLWAWNDPNYTVVGKSNTNYFQCDTRYPMLIRISDPTCENFGQIFDACEYYSWLNEYVFDNGCPGGIGTEDWSGIDVTTDGATPLIPIDPTDVPGERCIRNEFVNARGYNQINHHFSYGFGDLRIEDRRFGQTNIRDLRDIKVTQNQEAATEWLLPPQHGTAAPLLQQDTSTTATGYGFTDQLINLNNTIDETIYTNVNSVEGGQLINNDDTFPDGENWIIREGPPNTVRIELLFNGRFFELDPSVGYENLSLNIIHEYRPRDSGAGGWIPFGIPNSIFTNDGEWVFCEEIELDVPVGQYDIRVRITNTVPPINKNQVIEISLSEIKFYQVDPAKYCGVNQEFVSVRASEQLSGALDRMSADVYAKCWDWDGAAWVWRETQNPASWFLYMARGGFCNETNTTGNSWPRSPTTGWVNYAGEKDRLESNDYRLFGAGIPDREIDFECLQAWHEFCDDNSLTFNAIFDNHRTCNEALHLIANVGRASVQWSNSKLGVTYEDPDQLVAAIFTPYNIKAGSFSVSYQNTQLPDEVQCNYMNGATGNLDWTQESVFQTRPDLPAGMDPKKRVSIDLFGVTDANQAQRECNLIAAKQAYQRRIIKWKTDAEGLCVVRGDVVILSHWVTAWDWSGRPCSFETDGVNVTGLELDAEVCADLGFIYVRDPSGDLSGYTATFDGSSVTVTEPWPLSQAPGELDDEGTVNGLSLHPDCCASDWIIMAGPLQTPGKKVRITGITYIGEDNNEIEIVAVDEDPGYYQEEFNPGNYIPEESVAKPVIRSQGACAVSKGNGDVGLIFTLQGTSYATITYMIDSTGPFTLTYEGNEEFGSEQEYTVNFPVGSTVTLTIEPFVIGIPYKTESETITFVVE